MDFSCVLSICEDLLSPMEERALELEAPFLSDLKRGGQARADLPEMVEEEIESIKEMKKHVLKNMSWVGGFSEPFYAFSGELEQDRGCEREAGGLRVARGLYVVSWRLLRWWAKKQEQQKKLPLHEAPAYTKQEAGSRLILHRLVSKTLRSRASSPR